MNGPLVLELAKIIGAIVGFAAGVLVTYWRIRERRITREFGLAENPERCGDHAARLRALEGWIEKLERDNREDHNKIVGQIGALGIEIAKLSVGR